MSKEEVLNLFYAHRHREFYGEIEEHMVTAESIVLLLINKVDKIYDPVQELDVKLESPIVRWKELLGDKSPDEAGKQ